MSHSASTTLETARTGLVLPFLLGQQLCSFGLGSGLPHHLAPVHGFTLAFGHACQTIGQEVVDGELHTVGKMCVQYHGHRRCLLDDPNPGMFMAVDPTLMPLD